MRTQGILLLEVFLVLLENRSQLFVGILQLAAFMVLETIWGAFVPNRMKVFNAL